MPLLDGTVGNFPLPRDPAASMEVYTVFLSVLVRTKPVGVQPVLLLYWVGQGCRPTVRTIVQAKASEEDASANSSPERWDV